MKQRNILVSGLSLVLMTSVSSVAMAQCTGTGAAAGLAAQFAPFAVGGALNTLVSSINAANTAFLTQSTAFVGSPANPKPDQEGGGIWVRGIGGEIKTNSTVTSTYALGGNGGAFPLTPQAGSVTCNTSTNLQFAGTQVGTDMARLNWNGWNVHMGSMAGYLGARARDTTTAGALNAVGGTLTNQLEVPFVGAYAAATYGSFFIDGQIRWDFYQNTINDPVQNGLFNQKLDARGTAFTANAGYNFQLGNNWFIEPSAGIVVSKVKVDTLNATGTILLPANVSPNLSLPNRTQFTDIESYLARLSVRIGTTIVSDRMIWQPFVTASVYHDFAGNAGARYAESAAFEVLNPPVLSGTLSATNLGTYGQFAVGLAGQVAGTGWLGYLRADYRTGDRIEGYSLNGGLRYQFTPDGAPLAPKGLITKAPALAAAPYNWNGFYIGATFGGLNGWTKWSQPGLSTDPRFAGAMAGGQAGYDWQIGKWVIGLEGMGTWTNASGARDCNTLNLFNCESGMNWFATGTARVGYAYWDRALIYVKGGVAAAELTSQVSCNTGATAGFGVCTAAGGAFVAPNQTKVGWTIGYGTEFALTQNWTVKGETSYFDLGRTTFNYPTVGAIDVKTTGMTGTVGLNYRFATGGPVRY